MQIMKGVDLPMADRVNSPRIAGTGNPNSMSEFQLRDSLVLKTSVAIANSKTLLSSHCE